MLALIGILVAAGCGSSHERDAADPPTPALRICFDQSMPFFFEEADQQRGIEHDLLAGYAASLGIEAALVEQEIFDDVLDAVADGKCDVGASTITATSERAARFDLSAPYFPVRVVLVSSLEDPIDGLEALANRTVATIAGSRYADLVRDVPGIRLIEVGDGDAQFALVASGQADAMAFDSALVLSLIGRFPTLGISAALSDLEHYAFILPKGSPHRVRLNAYLADTLADGRFEAILGKYFDADHVPDILESLAEADSGAVAAAQPR